MAKPLNEYPKVSVIVPFYSGINWLCEAVESVLLQDYSNIEIIVINDGSSEDMTDFIDKYGDKIILITRENGGPASARNTGIDAASGKYVAMLDSDDLWLPGKLTHQISEMEKYDAVWGQHSYEMFWEGSDKIKSVDSSRYTGDVLRECYISFRVATDCIVVLKEALDKDNIRYPVEKRFGEDAVFYRELAKRYPLHYTDGVYARVRIRGGNAGFNAKVQLLDRAAVWETLQTDNKSFELLSRSVCLAYRMTFISAKLIRHVQNKRLSEIVSKILYVLPYILFHINTK